MCKHLTRHILTFAYHLEGNRECSNMLLDMCVDMTAKPLLLHLKGIWERLGMCVDLCVDMCVDLCVDM